MPSAYPPTNFVGRAVVNRADVVYDETKLNVLFAEDYLAIADELVAIETELTTFEGSDFVFESGSYADPVWITSLAKSKVGLSAVENTALSTWVGSGNITTVGTVTQGVWNAGTVTSNANGVAISIWNTVQSPYQKWALYTDSGGFYLKDVQNTRYPIEVYAQTAGSGTPFIISPDGSITIGSTIEIQSTQYSRGSFLVLNKAENGWLSFAGRNTAGSQVVYDLANVGTISSGAITSSGVVQAKGFEVVLSPGLAFGASKMMFQQEDGTVARIYVCGPDTSTYGHMEYYVAKSNGSPVSVLAMNADGTASFGGRITAASLKTTQTPSAVGDIASTHKVSVDFNGNTFYFLLSNV